MKAYYRVTVTDSRGRTIRRTRWRLSRSFVANYLRSINNITRFANVSGVIDTGGTSRTLETNQTRKLEMDAGTGVSAFGPVVGTGTAPVAIYDFRGLPSLFTLSAPPPPSPPQMPAPVPPLPITRRAGDPTGGFVLLRHRGEGGRFNIGYGTAAAQVFGHGDPFRFFIAQEETPPHLVSTDMIVRIPQGPWPSAALAGPGRYDPLKSIDNADTRESVYQDWDQDVFEVFP